MKLQIVDLLSDDMEDGNDASKKNMIVTLYGKTEDNKSIVCSFEGYKPYFYMKIPASWSKSDVNNFFTIKSYGVNAYIRKKYEYNPIYDFYKVRSRDIVTYKELYGYRCNADKTPIFYNFVKLHFSSHSGMNSYCEAIRETYSTLKRMVKGNKRIPKICKAWMSVETDGQCDSHLYEASIHPIIRFIHESGIQPANWIDLDITEDDFEPSSLLFPNIHIYVKGLTIDTIKPIEHSVMSPYVIASFDIECDSSHGDFPQPTKDFKKLAIDIYDTLLHQYEQSAIDIDTLIVKFVKRVILAGFSREHNEELQKHGIYINHVYTKQGACPSEDAIEKVVELFEGDFLTKLVNVKSRDKVIQTITKELNTLTDEDGTRLEVEGDKVIQIGTVFHRYGDTEPYKRHILVIAPEDNLPDDEICADLDTIEVVRCKSELDLLLQWTQTIKEMDPDYITGYNIFGFDFAYMMDRVGVYDKSEKYKFMNLGKINSQNKIVWKNHRTKKCGEKKIKVSTFGTMDYNRYINMDGRIIYDLQKEVEKGHNLESYKLDNVAAHFMRGNIKHITSHHTKIDITHLYTHEFGHLKVGDYVSIRLHSNIGETYYQDNQKFKIYKLDKTGDEPRISILGVYMKFNESIEAGKKTSTWEPENSEYFKIEWCLMKDDVSPQDIFEKHKTGGPKGRAEVAKYCIQDCELCINLTLALDIIPNNIAMANVCSVPQSYIYLRGQGAKIFSLISKFCDLKGVRMPTLERPFQIHDYVKVYKEGGRDKTREKIIEDQEEERGWCGLKDWYIEDLLDQIEAPPPRAGYEGAIVLDPTPGIYLDDPVGVVDYASLYPSSIIEKNISHDTIILDKEYLDRLTPEVDYETIEYDNYVYATDEGKVTVSKKIDEHQKKITCHFLKRKQGQPLGIIPDVVSHLLRQRKATKKLLKQEKDEFKKKVLDGMQLSYKLVANSVYGQMGARTSPIYFNKLAACTTSIGRQRIYDAKDGVEQRWWRESAWAVSQGCKPPEVIYGDTDSVFIKWSRYKNGIQLEDKEALQFCIDCGKDAGEWITHNMLNSTFIEDPEQGIYKPQDLEYEKTFYPFILISKKRYVADKYEFKTDYCSRNSMGIVLKRRDNAPIVKHVFGNVIEKIMIDKDFDKTVEWLKDTLEDIRKGTFTMRQFVITKSLRGYYKNPKGIAHKVLADRMGERDPGNKPKPGDRMPFAYRVLPQDMLQDKDNVYKSGRRKGQPKDKKVLQGDRIEDPDYIVSQNLDLDYEFYITNQIMNPVKQVLDLRLDPKATELLFKK
jgi:DNA polymerase elongation subunit (family B)